jgi:hypothetical protein
VRRTCEKKRCPPGHPDIATSLSNLAALYQAQRRASEAESLSARARAIEEKASGRTHPESNNGLDRLRDERARPEAQIGHTRGRPSFRGSGGFLAAGLGSRVASRVFIYPPHPRYANGQFWDGRP